MERFEEEGQRGGHAEDRDAKSAGRRQDRPWAAREGLGRHEGHQDKVGLTWFRSIHLIDFFQPCHFPDYKGILLILII